MDFDKKYYHNKHGICTIEKELPKDKVLIKALKGSFKVKSSDILLHIPPIAIEGVKVHKKIEQGVFRAGVVYVISYREYKGVFFYVREIITFSTGSRLSASFSYNKDGPWECSRKVFLGNINSSAK